VAAYGVGLRLHMIILLPAFALGGAAATMVGQNLGAGKPERAARAAWAAAWFDMAIMFAAAVVIMLGAPLLIRCFNNEADVIQIGARYLRIVSPSYLITALGIVLGRALNGAGDSLSPMVITMISLWGVQVPLAMLLAYLWQPATAGIWWAIAAANALHGLMIAGWFETGRWRRRQV
jgi:Na+-driven multidrug efflux pump